MTRERQLPVPPLQVELAPVHRVGATGRRFLTRKAAYLAAARAAYSERYTSGDDAVDYDTGWGLEMSPGAYRGSEEHRKRVVGRLAQFLQYRDSRRAAGAR